MNNLPVVLSFHFLARFAVYRVLTQLLGVGTLLLTARWMGANAYGEVTAILSLAAVTANLAGLSLGQTLHRYFQINTNISWRLLVGTLQSMALILGGVGAAIGLALQSDASTGGAWNISPALIAAIIALCPLLIWEDYFAHLASLYNQLTTLAHSQISGRCVTLLALAFLTAFSWLSRESAIAAFMLGSLIIFLLSNLSLKSHRFELNHALAWNLLKSIPWLHLNTMGSLAIGQANILIVAYFEKPASVAHYQIASQMITAILWVPQAIIPVMYSGIAASSPDLFWPTHRRLLIIGLLLTGCIALLGSYLAPLILPWLVGQDYIPAVTYFHELLPVLLGMSFAQLLTPQWLARGLFKESAILTFLLGIASIIAARDGAAKTGVEGVISVNLITYGIIVPSVQLIFALWCGRRVSTVKPYSEKP
ncbi:lipopolysaccharide biosynthesis protein [Methylomagnum sp.]